MKVLIPSASYILTDYLPFGEGIACFHLIKELSMMGHEIHAIAPNIRVQDPPTNVFLYEVGKFHYPSRRALLEDYGRTKFSIRSLFQSLSIIKNRGIEVIHHIAPFWYEQSYDILVFFKANIPFIYGPAFSPYRMPKEQLQNDTETKARVFSYKLRTYASKEIGNAEKWLFHKTIENSDLLLFGTRETKRFYKKFNIPYEIIPYGVDTRLFKPRVRIDTGKRAYEILAVSYLIPMKGLKYLIRAMPFILKEMPNTLLRIVGTEPDEIMLRRLCKSLALNDKVIFEGFVLHSQLVKYYQNCDIFCHPPLYEAFGQVILEAMACEAPIVATKVGGIPEIVRDGEHGLLVPLGNEVAIANAILKLLCDDILRIKIGEKNVRHVIKHFSWETIAKKLSSIYQTLAREYSTADYKPGLVRAL